MKRTRFIGCIFIYTHLQYIQEFIYTDSNDIPHPCNADGFASLGCLEKRIRGSINYDSLPIPPMTDPWDESGICKPTWIP